MVRKTLLPLLLLALLLAGCSFFTASLFPAYLPQAEKSYDLGPSIDGFLASLGSMDYLWRAQLAVLSSGAVDYGGLLIEIDSRPDKTVFFADPAGIIHSPMAGSAVDDSQLGSLHMTALSGDFIVGRVPISTTFVPGTPVGILTSASGFSDGAYNYVLWTSTPQALAYQRFDASWTAVGVQGSATIDLYGSYNLQGVFYDPSATAGREVVLVLQDYSSNRLLVAFTPLADFKNGTFPTAPATYVVSYPYLQFFDVQSESVSYTRKGIVVVDFDGNVSLMDFNGKETGKKLNLGQGGRTRIAFDIEGDDLYVFNPDRRTLYWGKSGW